MKIAITGIKSLKKATKAVELKKMTVITGQNSSGKTSYTLGLRLLSQNLKKNDIFQSFDLFKIKVDPSVTAAGMTMNSLSNGDVLHYDIYFGKNNLSKLELILKPNSNNDKYDFTEVSYFHEGKLILLKSLKDKIPNIFHINFYSVQILLGNLGVENIKKIKNAILFLIELRKVKGPFEFLEKKYIEGGFSNIIPSLYPGDLFENIKEDELFDIELDLDFIELIFICSKYFQKNEELSSFVDYINSNAIHTDKLLNLNDSKKVEVIKEIQSIVYSENPLDNLAAYNIINTKTSEISMIRKNVSYSVGNSALSDEAKKYFEEAEGVTFYEYLVDDEINLGASVDSNSFFHRFQLMCYDWVEANIFQQIAVIKEMQFDSDLSNAQKEFFLSTDNSSLFEFSKKYSQKSQVQLSSINKILEKFDIGKRIEIEEHLLGNAYMIFLTNINDQKINIGNLGSGHFYIIRLILLLFMKIEDQSRERNKNRKHQLRNMMDEDDRIIMVLTEPETNLHPNLQANLCDMLVGFTKEYDVMFIVETHSEYLIRNLQLNIAQKNIDNAESKIYFFENNCGQTEIRKIRLDKNGFLLDKFGTGFLDMSQKTIENLFKVKQN